MRFVQIEEAIDELNELADSISQLALTVQSVTTALDVLEDTIRQGKYAETHYCGIQRQKLRSLENALKASDRLSHFYASALSRRKSVTEKQKQMLQDFLLKTRNLELLLKNLIEKQTPIVAAVTRKSIEFEIQNFSQDEIEQRLQSLRRSTPPPRHFNYSRIYIELLETRLSELTASERPMTGSN